MDQLTIQSPRDPTDRREFDAFVGDINRTLERVARALAELRGDDGIITTFRSGVFLGGNIIRGVGASENDDDACSRGELKRNAMYATTEGHTATRPIIAQQGMKLLPGRRAGDSALSKREIEQYVEANAAPNDAEYLVGTANGNLTAERVVIDTATVTWDLTTAGQAKANAVVAGGSGDEVFGWFFGG